MLFPPNDYLLIAVILGMPLLGAFVNGVWGKYLGKDAVRLMALSAVGISFVASVAAFIGLSQLADQAKGEHVKLAWTAWEWMHTTGGASGANVPIDVKFSIDALSGVMMLIVTGVGFLIHLYSTSYMADDKGFARFFAYMNLFIFSMLVLILGDNLPILFVGWEGVGLCSYLLIGFWYEHMPNAAAGKKAFIANRIGDFGLICAMFLLVHYTGALDWNGIANGAGSLLHPGEPFRVHVWPLGGGQYTGFLHFLQPKAPVTISAATAVGIALLLGCTGKSAQIPLYVWLPDAMAGPTPVSALIHAATMVTAGIYLICRLSFVFVLSPFTMMLIACVGAGTALFAATIAVVQNDIKKVLAYSTVSQLGLHVPRRRRRRLHLGLLPRLHARLLQGLPVPRRRLGDPCDALADPRRRRLAGHPQHGRPAQVDAPDPLDLRGRDGRDHRPAAHQRLLLEGRDPLPLVRRSHGQPARGRLVRAAGLARHGPVRGRGARGHPHGLLHVPPLLPHLLGRLPRLDGGAAFAAGEAGARGARRCTATTRSTRHHHEDLVDPGLPAPRVAVADDGPAHHPRDLLACSRVS